MKIGVLQLNSKLEPEENLITIRKYLAEAQNQALEAVFLPECFYSMSDGKRATPYQLERGNEHYKAVQSLAKEFGIALLGGSAASVGCGSKAINRNYNFDKAGTELEAYDKIHLFSCDLSRHESKKVIDEGDIYISGSRPQILSFGQMKIGLSICFDLRFPEMYRRYFEQGTNVLSVSAAFTVPTGKAHWHTLLRARAIENQCFVVAAAQWGHHNERIQTFGHSLVVDPWGEILADAGEGVKLVTAELDFNRQREIRSRLNVQPDNL